MGAPVLSFWLGLFAGATLGLAQSAPIQASCDLSEPERATVASVEDGATLLLSDGRTVRLIGAHVASPPLGWRGDGPWPLVKEAKDALARLAAGKDVELKFDGRRSDRHGHLLAHVFVMQDGERIWLQQALIADGWARVYSFPDNRACAAELLATEVDARGKRRGVWGASVYRVRDATDVKGMDRLMDSYQLVEGVVRAVGEGGGRLYLNFGDNWRGDFTVSIERKHMKHIEAFVTAGIDPSRLNGKRIRARGWLQWRNGPEIRATHRAD